MALFIPKDRKSLFRQYLSGMYDAVVITDSNGYVIETNPRASEHFGYDVEEFVDRHVSTFIPALAPDTVQRIRKAMADDRHIVVDVNGQTKAGEKFACEVAVTPIELMDPNDIVFTIRNVERRRVTMNALRAKAKAFELAQEGLFACSPEGTVQEANSAFCAMLGLGEDAAGRNILELLAGDETKTCLAAACEGSRSCVRVGELTVTLVPNGAGRKLAGVVGRLVKEG